MLTRAQRAEFDRLGFVRLSGVFTETEAGGMREHVWAALAERYGVQRDQPDTWTVEQPRHLQSLVRAGVFDGVASPGLIGALDDLLGPGTWQRPRHWGSPLISFPRGGAEWCGKPGPFIDGSSSPHA